MVLSLVCVIGILLTIGIIMAALGMETSSGDFEVVDLCFAGLPDLVKPTAGPSGTSTKGKEKEKVKDSEKTWVALASGLSVGSQEAPADLKVQLLVEWLTGETGGVSVRQVKVELMSRIK